MPKKTKAEKIIARLRRKVLIQQTAVAPQGKTIAPKKVFFPPSQSEPEIKEGVSSFVIADLRKSLFLTTLAIALQFVLYYLLELGGNKNFRWIIDLIKK